MRIAFLGSRGIPANYSGFETFYEQISTRLARRGHDVIVFNRYPFVPYKEDTYKGVRLVKLPTISHKSLDTIAHTFLSVLMLPFLRPDIAYFCGVGNAIFCLPCRWLGIPAVINVDGEDWARKKWSGFASKWLLWSESWAARFADIVIADAKVIQHRYRDLYGCATIYVPYGANIPTATPPSNILQKLGLEADDYVLFVSRLVPENRAELLIEAFKGIATTKKLVIVGDAPYSEDYKTTLRKLADDRVVFAGYVFGDDYAALSRGAALFCLPSGIDGTRPVLLDQMGFGNCIVVRNSAANVEVGGNAVATFDGASEIESLRGTIARLLIDTQERHRLGALARERVARLYDWDVITLRYEDLFKETLSNRRLL
jgi:glycosyltransferase involved in cell wall biosynthesis